MNPNICVVGSSNIDLVARVPRLPAPGETLIGKVFASHYGGKGANQAVMAARLGATVHMVSKVGRDVFGQDIVRNYREQGCGTTYILYDDERASGVAVITVDDNTGQNSIIIVPGANGALSPDDVRKAAPVIEKADVLVAQLETPVESTIEAFRMAQEQLGILTLLNPAPAAEIPEELYRLTDVLLPNEVEAAMMTGIATDSMEGVERAARALQKRGTHVVIITLGGRGALIAEGDNPVQHIAAEPVQAVDTTGAGDAFVGSMAYLLAKKFPLAEAVQRSCAIATRSVLKAGAQSSYPAREEVAALLER
jgi:ribokinase